MFGYILKKSNEYSLNWISLKLFHAIIPVQLYDCEIWGFESINILEIIKCFI